MMWMLFIMDGNRQEKKWLVVKHNALKWAKANNASPKKLFWRVPMANGMIVTLSSWLWWL